MSRNLLARVCVHCEHPVEFRSLVHPITEEEAGRYYPEYEGMMVAAAQCPMCLAEYLAWVDTSTCKNPIHSRTGWKMSYEPGAEPIDLSYLSTFNDEPGEEDLPKYDVQKIVTWHRVARIRE